MIFFENIKRFKNLYKNFFFKNIKIQNKINFGSHQANLFFLEKLKRSRYYFEYGSGSSTLIANKFKKKFLSIELDKLYYDIIKKKINKKGKIKFINIGPVGEFSYPLVKLKGRIKKYVECIDEEFKKNTYPDLILVDGRFRVACCLNLLKFEKINKGSCTIIIDDYTKRKEYHILKSFFFIKKIGRLALLKSKNISRNKIKKTLKENYFVSK
tara:strand:+ start:166 stop:801 length:636 start_codon:yes stop_codon:yes gene_type:complete